MNILLIACDDNNTGWYSGVSRWGDLQERGEWLKAVEWLAIVVGCEGRRCGGTRWDDVCVCVLLLLGEKREPWTCDVREKPGS